MIDICNTELQLMIPKDPATILLHHNEHTVSSYKKSLLQYALNTGKIIIPRKWKTTAVPTIAEWTSEIEDIRKYEDLHANSPNAKRNHWETW
ncbi:hypothetical protein XELAEV_18046318mg [Xenopus laevis]|uniref:Uncharacterized protein n=1 Tax=Xenopus laevis TaxID=8355 RepID=A0A974H0I0_XENLA|nr:hypothetical protein XELAEV_18046318mg [Xenopus laevis]